MMYPGMDNGDHWAIGMGMVATVAGAIGAVVFGSDQGLVGQFNDLVADYAVLTLCTSITSPSTARTCRRFGIGSAA